MDYLKPIIEDVLSRQWLKQPTPFRAECKINNPKICVITGENASGKSLIRKSIQAYCRKNGILCMHFSMSGKTSGFVGSCFVYGSEEDDSTGYNSVCTFLKAIEQSSRPEKNCIVFDEPEIGCSLGTQLAMGRHLAFEIQKMTNIGVFVITHSNQLVDGLGACGPSHINMDDTYYARTSDWVNRPIVPTDLEKLKERNMVNWRTVEDMLKAQANDSKT